MTKKLIAKNVPLKTTKTYESCGECHFYVKIYSYITGGLRFDGDAGGPKEVYKMGCNKVGNLEIENPDEVHRNCPYSYFGIPDIEDLNLDSLLGFENR